ncbi:MAG: bifunctional phosphoribosyl-AMP cyclohydrolase/phosphoribosyl-ATP diphosphatase HisIE [Truepera sp.]|nr:bifunctional phosphoribosyl-AMP cyclohydrolase/phosphoribosyl-ATP diphosphatase HisIE [Truepera sp.]
MTEIAFDANGLVPVVAQSSKDRAVLMLAYADREAVRLTLETGEAHYFSRSRAEVWRKGATSGNTQSVLEVRYDCDADALLYLVDERGPACHTGERSCFYRVVDGSPAWAGGGQGAELGAALEALQLVIQERLETLPEGSYVRRLHERGLGYVAQKVVEEAGETVVAALQADDHDLVAESADLLFHLCVLLTERGVSLGSVADKLAERRR